MKKVNYYNRIGLKEVMGMNPLAIGPTEGEFIGIIKEDNEDYLIARTIKAFNEDPEYIGKITARHVIAEYVPDDTMSNIYIDMEEDNKTRTIEEALNMKDKERKITEKVLENVINRKYNDVIKSASMSIPRRDENNSEVIYDQEIYVVSIDHELFKTKQKNIQELENRTAHNSGMKY